MIQRIKQFVRGCLAQGPTQAEQQLIAAYLQPAQQQLFYEMNIADQRHCLNVLSTAQELFQEALDQEQVGQEWSKAEKAQQQALLVRCCLLHDIGRGYAMGPIRKTWGVLCHKLWPHWAKRHSSSQQSGYLRDILYRYYYHPSIGAARLRELGMEEEAAIIELHHSRNADNIPLQSRIILTFLKKSDELN